MVERNRKQKHTEQQNDDRYAQKTVSKLQDPGSVKMTHPATITRPRKHQTHELRPRDRKDSAPRPHQNIWSRGPTSHTVGNIFNRSTDRPLLGARLLHPASVGVNC